MKGLSAALDDRRFGWSSAPQRRQRRASPTRNVRGTCIHSPGAQHCVSTKPPQPPALDLGQWGDVNCEIHTPTSSLTHSVRSAYLLVRCALKPLSLGAWERAAVVQDCPGDCNGDGQVVINELITVVNIGLGALPVPACSSADQNGNGVVEIHEVSGAVNRGLTGCAFA